MVGANPGIPGQKNGSPGSVLLHGGCPAPRHGRPGHERAGRRYGSRAGVHLQCRPPRADGNPVLCFGSQAGNNGSAFAGLAAGDTPFYSLLGGLAMLLARFGTIISVMMIAGSMASGKISPPAQGTMGTDNPDVHGSAGSRRAGCGSPHLLPGLGSGTYSGAFALVFGNHALKAYSPIIRMFMIMKEKKSQSWYDGAVLKTAFRNALRH